MKKVIAMALVVSACGTWSNEDLEFIYALPDKATLHSNVPGEAAALTGVTMQGLSVGDDSMTYASTKGQTDKFNQLLDAILDGLDNIRTIPPTTRAEDSRIWGPYDDSTHPGFQVQVEIDRDGGMYDWAISYRPQGGAFFDIGTGYFVPTVSLKEGQGGFFLDGLKSRQEFDAGSPSDPNTVTVTYQTDIEPKSVEMEFGLDGGSSSYRYEENDAGQVIAKFAVTGTDPNITSLEYTVRWDTSSEGRADALVTKGAYSGAAWVECWNTGFKVVYSVQNWPGGADAGLEAACVQIPDF